VNFLDKSFTFENTDFYQFRLDMEWFIIGFFFVLNFLSMLFLRIHISKSSNARFIGFK
jgi:hypothetical protein